MPQLNMSELYTADCYYSVRLLNRLKEESILQNVKLDFDLIKKAIIFAKKYHDGQFRKSGEPFYTHPLEVAYMISEIPSVKLKNDVIIASILHDVVEDTNATIGMILDTFGWRVAQMVDMLTRDRPDGTKLSVEAILNNAYKAQDKDVLFIKLIDRLHNMKTICSMHPDKQKKIAIETLKRFVVLNIYLDGTLATEKHIIKLCYQQLAILEYKHKSQDFYNFQLPSLALQSKLYQNHIL